MKTEVIMRRELFGQPISQQSKTEFFSATDLVYAGNMWRVANKLSIFNINEWFRRKATAGYSKSYSKSKLSAMLKGAGTKFETNARKHKPRSIMSWLTMKTIQ